MTAPPMPDAALLPCPACGGKARREVFDSERIQATVLMCANHHLFGGNCLDTRCYLDEVAWNRRAGQAHERRADAGLLAALADPHNVHINMLRGPIAKLPVSLWAHTHGLTNRDGWLQMTLEEADAAIAAAKGHDQ